MAAIGIEPCSIDQLEGPPGLPLVGNLFDIRFSRFHRQLEEWADRYGPLYRLRFGPRRVLVLSDAECIKRMFRERPDLFRRTRALEDATVEMRLNGVFSAEGDNWRRQRKLVAAALNPAHLKPFYPRLRAITERLQRRWERAADNGTPVDLCRDLMRFTVDVTTDIAFGLDFNTLETDGPVIQQQLDKVFPILNTRVNAPIPYWRLLRLPRDRELDRALVEVEHRVNGIIADVRARMQADPGLFQQPTNFLEAIIAAKEVEGVELSDGDIFANVCTVLLAGEDTTANSLAWAVDYFLKYPEHWTRARAEVDGVLGDAAVPPTLDAAGDLPFVDAFVNESMRLKPVAPLNAMEPLQDIELLGCRIPRGTVIMMLTRRIAMDEPRFGHADRFDPERWLKREPVAGCPHDITAFVPFGSGPRFCPGRNLALLEIRTVLSMLLRNFDIALADPGRPVEELLAFTMMPTNLVVRMRRRGAAG